MPFVTIAPLTYCRDCDRVHPDTRKSEPWKWRCMAFPTAPGFGFVDPDFSPTPPYARCYDVNRHGECEMFEPLRVAPEKADG